MTMLTYLIHKTAECCEAMHWNSSVQFSGVDFMNCLDLFLTAMQYVNVRVPYVMRMYMHTASMNEHDNVVCVNMNEFV